VYNWNKFTRPWCKEQTAICPSHKSTLLLQTKQGRGQGTWSRSNKIYSSHPHRNFTIKNDGSPKSEYGERTPYIAAFSVPSTAFVFIDLTSNTTPVSTEPILPHPGILTITRNKESAWANKVFQAYETVYKYHLAIQPGKPLSNTEMYWINAIHNMEGAYCGQQKRLPDQRAKAPSMNPNTT
jgi:hypothetical protein